MIYMGSKSRIARDIVPILTANMTQDQTFVDIFCGGCNITDKIQGKRLANDSNPYLIAMWQELQKGWLPGFYTREQYADIRANKSAHPAHIVGWVGFVHSFRGKFFGGYIWYENSKYKDKPDRNRFQESVNNILKQVPHITDVVFSSVDYLALPIPSNAVVYCDPPYANTTKYMTGDFDHLKFWQWVRDLSQTHTVYVSEYTAPDDFVSVYSKSIQNSLSGVYSKSDTVADKQPARRSTEHLWVLAR